MKSIKLNLITAATACALAVPAISLGATLQTYKSTSPMTAKTTPAKAAVAKPAPVDDKTLTDRIDAKLKADAKLKRFDVDVSVKNGIATLTGKVRTAAERVRAGRDAHVPGVTKVDNQLALDKDAGKPLTEEVKDTTKAAGEKVKSATETAGEKTKEGLSKTGEVINDGWITTKVHANFVNEDLLKGSDINVDTANHVVTLKGTVKTEAGRARAVQIARTTDGVTKVIDKLVIK
jgi:hyperosmotically inducible protein